MHEANTQHTTPAGFQLSKLQSVMKFFPIAKPLVEAAEKEIAAVIKEHAPALEHFFGDYGKFKAIAKIAQGRIKYAQRL